MLPYKGSFEIVYNNRVVYKEWYDGSTGYELSDGKKVKADPDEFKDKKFKKNIFDELDSLDSTLWKLELLNDEKVNGEDCYKIRATLVNGLVRLLYFSKTTYYQLREDKVSNEEKDSFSSSYFSDYKKFGDLIVSTTMRLEEGDHIKLQKLESFLSTRAFQKAILNDLITQHRSHRLITNFNLKKMRQLFLRSNVSVLFFRPILIHFGTLRQAQKWFVYLVPGIR